MDDWNEESVERVMMFSTEPHHLNVSFSKHAGIYRLPVIRDDFVKQMTNIADGLFSLSFGLSMVYQIGFVNHLVR